MSTALIVSGGGSKGAFAVGAIEALREKGTSFDIIGGTSTGALIAPLVALDDIDEMIKQYTEVRTKDIIRKNWRGLFWRAVYHTRPLEKRIRASMSEGSPSRYERLMQKETPRILICAVSLQSVATSYFSQTADDVAVAWKDQEEMVQALLGSSSQPMFMPPPEFLGQQWVDGGVREIAPIGAAIRAGADEIYVIINSAPEMFDKTDEHYGNLLSIGKRSLDLIFDEIILNDVKYAELYNKVIRKSDGFEGKREVNITVIRPAKPLPADGLDFDPEVMQRMRALGKEAVG